MDDAVHLFQQVGGLECKPVTGEITYGLERLAMHPGWTASMTWSGAMAAGKTTYGDVFHQNEVEQSTYNLNMPTSTSCSPASNSMRKEAQQLLALETPLPLPAYERILKRLRLQPAGCA